MGVSLDAQSQRQFCATVISDSSKRHWHQTKARTGFGRFDVVLRALPLYAFTREEDPTGVGFMYWTVSKSVAWLARSTAIAGGGALLVVIALTCISVTGRSLDGLGLKPIPGDIELVELGIGFAVFAAMPFAQFSRAHARVDMLQRAFGAATNRLLDLAADLLMFVFTAIVASRLWLGMLDKAAYGETSFILQIPVAWGYRAAMITCVIGVIVAAFCVLRSTRLLFGKEA